MFFNFPFANEVAVFSGITVIRDDISPQEISRRKLTHLSNPLMIYITMNMTVF